jgi:hypothetical protein
MWAGQRPADARTLGEPSGAPAWKTAMACSRPVAQVAHPHRPALPAAALTSHGQPDTAHAVGLSGIADDDMIPERLSSRGGAAKEREWASVAAERGRAVVRHGWWRRRTGAAVI